ncbi:D-arabinono-1,4-lactone oxidase [Coemansia sp. RSA 1813]|nr:D-arabinono-1,4-lactone oxidase [Coemansia sp. RSA 1646]KAJ1769742.1 D-arabinono-1,4-lactone oxidase [Coemansia sp. RSA 1843]KAJ2090095.1 D-arabinono-1,4-lactone oxidase [Coemansia sp. RSA 986]KAJ2214170.1 D-arabinono-1,4-lactone oxidase [Coemansia sp. RSA 487]KAJ2568500.1 D-arabinono-1,4-lactone oxidase [Coemansia sp. RSA 1813]
MSVANEMSSADLAFLESLRCKPHGHKFTNWAGTFSSHPAFYLAPDTERSIIEIICIANRYRLGVKAIGSGHSPSDLACTDAIMLNMDRMDRVLAHDPYACTLTVESGIRLHALHQKLEDRKMALSSVGSISDQSVAGAMATATHGTGIEYADISGYVTHLVIIDGLGRRHECSAETNSDLFDAARCGLGALGIITQVTIQCEPAFLLHAVQEPTSMDRVLDDFLPIAASAEHVRVWWFPHTDHAVVWKANRTALPKQSPPDSFLRDRLYGFHIYQMQLYKARLIPSDIPRLAEAHFSRRFDRRIEWVDSSYRVFNFDCLFPQYVNEWAVPLDEAVGALRELRAWIDSQSRDPRGVRVHFPVEIRFVRASSVWLSPAYGQSVCYIGVIMYRPYRQPVPYKKYWRAYEDTMRTHGGRPHWAKAHRMFYFELQKTYPRFDDFVSIRNKCDPNGVFVNDYICRHILPPSDHAPVADACALRSLALDPPSL